MSYQFTANPIVSVSTPFASETTVSMQLGAIARDTSGNKYRYTKFGGAVVRGTFVQSATPTAAHLGLVIAAAAAVGDKTLTITNGATAVTVDQYAGGTLTVTSGTGIGQVFNIVGNTDAAAAGVITVTIEQGVLYAIPAASTLNFQVNRYDGAVTATTTPTEVLGLAMADYAADSYGFILVNGIAAAKAGAAITAGDSLTPSTVTGGTLALTAAATDVVVGTAISAIASAEAGLVHVFIS